MGRDYRAELTSRIIDLIEQGAAPWQRPWSADTALLALPYNPVTGGAYRGMNRLSLMIKATEAGYEDPRWCTLRQANARDWHIRKGERATWVEYWKWARFEDVVNEESGEIERKLVPLENPVVFYAKVFNAAQMDGPQLWRPPEPAWRPHEAAALLLASSGARMVHDGGSSAVKPAGPHPAPRAFYDYGADLIHLPPPAAFHTESDYYDVALHELGHWSGHETRLNRPFGRVFGDPLYAREELRAEIASLFLSAEIGLPHNTARHASYVNSWIAALEQDKNEIFHAARDAGKIADYLLAFAPAARVTAHVNLDTGPELGESVQEEPGDTPGFS